MPPHDRHRPPRYVVASFTLEHDQQAWLANEAMRLTTSTKIKTSMSEIIRAVIASMMESQTNAHPDTE